MIIDAHVHIGSDMLGFNMNEYIVEEFIEKYNVDCILVSNGDSVEVDHEQNLIPDDYQTSQEDALKRTIEFARKHPGKIYVAAWVKPLTEKISEEFETLIKDNLDIIKAIKLHPYHSKISPVAPNTIPYLELADRYGLAVVSHTGNSDEDSPLHMYEAAIKFPNVNFVMAHMGLGTDNSLALDLLGKADNLYGDTAWVPMSTTLEAIKRYGTGKLVFGTDAPIDGVDTYLCNPKGERSMYQDYLHVLPDLIDTEAYEALMWKNGKKIYKVD